MCRGPSHLCHLNTSRTRPEGVVGLIALLPLVVALLAILRLAVLLLAVLRLTILWLSLSGLGSLEAALLGLSARVAALLGLSTRVAALLGLSAVLRLAVLPLLGLEGALLLGSRISTLLGLSTILRLALSGLGSLEATLLGLSAVLRLLARLVHGCTSESTTKSARVVNRRNLAVLEFQEQDNTGSTEADREEQEEDTAETERGPRENTEHLENTNQGGKNRDDTGGQEGPLLVREPVGSSQANRNQHEEDMEVSVAARREHREGIAVERPEGQDHRDDRQDEGSGHANERVGGAHGAALHLAGLGHDGALELVERCVRGCAELLGGSLKLLARRRALLAALSGVRGLLTRRSISLSAARGGVLGLLARLRAILCLAVALLLARRLGGVLPVGSGLRSSVLFRDNLSHGMLARPINDHTLKFLVRNRGGRGHGRFRQGRHLRLSNEGLNVFDNLLGFVHDRRRLNDRLGLDDRLGLNNRLSLLHHRSNSLDLRSTPRIRLHGLSFHSGLNNSSRLFNNRLSLLHHRSNSLDLGSAPRIGLHRLGLRSTPRVGLHGLSFHSGLNNSSRLFNNRLSLLHHRSNSLNLGSTPRIRLHRLGLRSTPRIRLHGLSLGRTPRVGLHGLSFHSGLNNSSRLFNNRLSLLHHRSNSLNLGSTPRIRLHRLGLRSTPRVGLHGRRVNNGSILNDRRGLNRRSFLCDGRRLDSGLFHGRGSLTVGIDRLRRGSDGSRLRNGRMSGNNTPVCQPLGKRRIQRRVRRHVGV